MAKIRSTLDIVMDRTKNLSMSSQDRENLKRKELSDTVRAWVQRYQDGKMTREDIRARIESAGEDRPLLVSLLKRELASEIRIGADNDNLIDALDRLCGVDRRKVTTLVNAYQAKLDTLTGRDMELLKLQLERDGIRGFSVVPNPARSESWQNTAREVQEGLTRELGNLL